MPSLLYILGNLILAKGTVELSARSTLYRDLISLTGV